MLEKYNQADYLMKKLMNYIKNNKKTFLFLFLWSVVFFWVTKEQITNAIQPGKGFAGRSILTQTVIIGFFSFLYFFLLSALGLFFKKYISPYLPNNIRIFSRKIFSSEVLEIAAHPAMQLTLMLWIVAFSYLHRGFDITDNGYYLLISHRYEDVAYEIRQFGIFTRLIYLAVGESVALMRIAGAMMLMAVTMICGWAIGRSYEVKGAGQKVLFMAIPAIPAVLFYRQWLSTPNYNWLTLLSGLLLLTGFMVLTFSSRRSQLAGGIVIGISGSVAFLSKLTTAAFFAGILIFVLLVERKKIREIIQVFLGGLIGLLVGVAFIYLNGQTIPGIYFKLMRGYEAISLFEHSVDSIFAPMWLYLKQLTLGYWWLWLGYTFFLVAVRFYFEKIKRPVNGAEYRILAGIWLAVLLLVGLFIETGYWAGLLYGFTLIFLFVSRFKVSGTIKMDIGWKKSILRSFYGVLIAFSIAFGTINQYTWVFANIICVFVLSLIFLVEAFPNTIRSFSQKGLVLLFLILVPFTMYIVPLSSKRPVTYGQDIEVTRMETKTSIRLGKEMVVTSPKYSEALTTLQNDAVANGFVEGTPIIDLTGMAPGLIYALDGRSPVYPWYSGGYPNSTKFVENILKDWTDEDFDNAWVLTSENKRQIPSSLVTERGKPFPDAFEKISSIVIPTKDNIMVELWRPIGH